MPLFSQAGADLRGVCPPPLLAKMIKMHPPLLTCNPPSHSQSSRESREWTEERL